VVRFDRFGTHMSVSDIFVFLILLLFGMEAAILTSAIEGFFSSRRVTRRFLTMAFNAAVMAFSTFAAAEVIQLAFGSVTHLIHKPYSIQLILAVIVMGLVQYLVNTGLISIGAALYRRKSVWATWENYYLCSSLTYLAAASASIIIAKLITLVGFYAFLAIAPIIGL